MLCPPVALPEVHFLPVALPEVRCIAYLSSGSPQTTAAPFDVAPFHLQAQQVAHAVPALRAQVVPHPEEHLLVLRLPRRAHQVLRLVHQGSA